MPLKHPTAFQKGDKLYLVAPVVPYTPSQQDIEEYAFGKSVIDNLRSQAPNDNIAWFGGHYVEGDRPNLNGAMWLSEDLAIASLTPLMMPVTVMHDPRTAVGVIAHAELLLRSEDQAAAGARQRAKIETALATWRHRFPEAVAEAEHNHSQGTLMQSMECLAPNYECSVCRMSFLKLPKGAEKENWCAHLKASQPSGGYSAAADGQNGNASRILRGVTFTGTGLIFGSRGSKGADPEANLESFQEEVAEFHDKAHRDGRYTPRNKPTTKRGARIMEIDDREYAELVKAQQERDSLKSQNERLETEAAKVPDLTKQVEALEAEKVTEKKRADDAEAKATSYEEQANKQTLRDERWGKLGSAFTEKLDSMPTAKANLLSDAAEMKEEAWEKRLSEIEEIAGVKRDQDKEGGSGPAKETEHDNAIFRREEVASFQGGGGSGSGPALKEPTVGQRQSTMRGLFAPPKKS